VVINNDKKKESTKHRILTIRQKPYFRNRQNNVSVHRGSIYVPTVGVSGPVGTFLNGASSLLKGSVRVTSIRRIGKKGAII